MIEGYFSRDDRRIFWGLKFLILIFWGRKMWQVFKQGFFWVLLTLAALACEQALRAKKMKRPSPFFFARRASSQAMAA